MLLLPQRLCSPHPPNEPCPPPIPHCVAHPSAAANRQNSTKQSLPVPTQGAGRLLTLPYLSITPINPSSATKLSIFRMGFPMLSTILCSTPRLFPRQQRQANGESHGMSLTFRCKRMTVPCCKPRALSQMLVNNPFYPPGWCSQRATESGKTSFALIRRTSRERHIS